ncbi:unnamed protein product [Rotaria socialis]|uniref:G domain-containing protein n=1 Tax=Rotaria socialis TaxID=392032 RepID=A0A821MDA9_9BILA|nr:unnamed protein product [Rotaria socialis]CAF4765277.1 unnamed protein product [Rotaria socialis]
MEGMRNKHGSHSIVVKTESKYNNVPRKYNVVVAGESGVGKTSVINAIFDNMQLATSSGAVGCTDECHAVRDSPKDYPSILLRMVDTVGLYESLEGTVSSQKAMEMLDKKLESLYATDGIHLILFCIRKGRQSQQTSQHYKNIVHNLCEDQVPCILVITRCEDDDPLGEWWEKNKVILIEKLQFHVEDAVAMTTLKKEENLEDYNESRMKLIAAIEKYALKDPWRAKDFKQKLSSFFRNRITRRSNVPPRQSDPLMEHLQRPMDAPATAKSRWAWLYQKIK